MHLPVGDAEERDVLVVLEPRVGHFIAAATQVLDLRAREQLTHRRPHPLRLPFRRSERVLGDLDARPVRRRHLRLHVLGAGIPLEALLELLRAAGRVLLLEVQVAGVLEQLLRLLLLTRRRHALEAIDVALRPDARLGRYQLVQPVLGFAELVGEHVEVEGLQGELRVGGGPRGPARQRDDVVLRERLLPGRRQGHQHLRRADAQRERRAFPRLAGRGFGRGGVAQRRRVAGLEAP